MSWIDIVTASYKLQNSVTDALYSQPLGRDVYMYYIIVCIVDSVHYNRRSECYRGREHVIVISCRRFAADNDCKSASTLNFATSHFS